MNRRSPGEGTVYQRNDGKWVAEVQLPNDHLGRRRRRKRTVKTKKEAERICRSLLADENPGYEMLGRLHALGYMKGLMDSC